MRTVIFISSLIIAEAIVYPHKLDTSTGVNQIILLVLLFAIVLDCVKKN